MIVEVNDDLSTIGIIQKIYVVDGDEIIFSIQIHNTTFNSHYRAYILTQNVTGTSLMLHTNLFTSETVHIRKSHIHEPTNSFVILPFALCTL